MILFHTAAAAANGTERHIELLSHLGFMSKLNINISILKKKNLRLA